MMLDNSKIRDETTYNLQSGRELFYKAEDFIVKEQGLLKFSKGLQTFQLWIQREKDATICQNLKAKYNEAVEEYQKMKDILDGKAQPKYTSDGKGVKPNKGGGKGEDDKESSKMKEAISEVIVSEKPNVKWDDIAGLINAKKALQEAVILPIKYPQLFVGAVTPWKGILLYGPPGTGKTYLAKACATETEGTFFSVSSADLISKYVGESEKMIKTLFALAREKKPSCIFIDEIDSLCGARSEGENDATRRVKTEFLVQMQGVGNSSDGILVLGATNLPWALDTAIRRRFEKRIYIPLPDLDARRFLTKHNLKKNENTLTTEQIDEIAAKTDGYSGSDMSNLVKDAVYGPVRKCQNADVFIEVNEGGLIKYMPVMSSEISRYPQTKLKNMKLTDITGDKLKVPVVCYDDFSDALLKSKTSVSKDQLTEYEKWTKEFGQDG